MWKIAVNIRLVWRSKKLWADLKTNILDGSESLTPKMKFRLIEKNTLRRNLKAIGSVNEVLSK